jgi:LPXTG-motif cell wall-anchored protein
VETQENGTQTVGDYNVTYAYGQEAQSSIHAMEKAALQNRLNRDDRIELLVQKQWFGTTGTQATYQLEYTTDGHNWQKYPESGIDGQGAYTGILTADNDWQEKIASLPKTDDAGNAYRYRIRETGDTTDFNVTYQVGGGAVTTDQSAALDASGQITITNTSTQYTQVSVQKLWKNSGGTDMSNPTESVTVELIQSVTKTPVASGGAANLTASVVQYGDGWRGDPSYTTLTENGQSVEIGSVVRLRFQINGGLDYLDEVTGVSKDDIQYVGGYPDWAVDFTVTGDMTLSFVTSSWIGNFQLTTLTPASQNGSASGEPETTETVLSTMDLTKENSWQHTWMDLPLRDKDGSAYTYTVQEVLVGGASPEDAEYAAAYTGQGTSSVTITNTSTKDQGYRLPATGAGGNRYPIYAACAALLCGAGLMYRSKRRRREER